MKIVGSRMRQPSRWQYMLFPILCLCVATQWLFSIADSEMTLHRHILKYFAPVQGIGEENLTSDSSPSQENPFAPVQGVGEKISSQYQHPFLMQECYTYKDLRARFICTGTHSFVNYSYEDIVKCASNLWGTIRNKRKRNHWRNPGSSYRKPSAKNALYISKRPSVHVVMVGDSHIRNIYESFFKRVQNARVWYRNSKMKKNEWRDSRDVFKNWNESRHLTYHDFLHLDVPLRVTYYWDHLLQELPKLLSSWMDGSEKKPTHLLLGSTLHYIKGPKDIFRTKGIKVASRPFYNHMKAISPQLRKLSRTAQVVFKFQDHLQVYSELVFDNVPLLDYYNKIASDLLVPRSSSFVVWNSTVPLSDLYEEECLKNGSKLPQNDEWRCYDKMHFGYVALDKFLDMYLNDFCSFKRKTL